jgi:hypothetical protein
MSAPCAERFTTYHLTADVKAGHYTALTGGWLVAILWKAMSGISQSIAYLAGDGGAVGPARVSPAFSARSGPSRRLRDWLSACAGLLGAVHFLPRSSSKSGYCRTWAVACGAGRVAGGGWQRSRSPPTMRAAAAVLVATRVPEAELEEPSCGALVRVPSAERGTRSETQYPTVGSFASGDGEGRAGFLERSRPRGASWAVNVPPGRCLAGE